MNHAILLALHALLTAQIRQNAYLTSEEIQKLEEAKVFIEEALKSDLNLSPGSWLMPGPLGPLQNVLSLCFYCGHGDHHLCMGCPCPYCRKPPENPNVKPHAFIGSSDQPASCQECGGGRWAAVHHGGIEQAPNPPQVVDPRYRPPRNRSEVRHVFRSIGGASECVRCGGGELHAIHQGGTHERP